MDPNDIANLITCPFCTTICIKMVFLSDGTGGHKKCIIDFLNTSNPKSMITNLPLSHKSWSPSKSHDELIVHYIKNTNILDKYLPNTILYESIDTIYMLYECNKLSFIDQSVLDTRLVELTDNENDTLTKILTIIDNYIIDTKRRDIIINNIFVPILGSNNEKLIINFLNISKKYDFVDHNRNNLLMIACHKKMTQLFSFLMDKMENPNSLTHINKYGNTVLILACDNIMENEAMKILEFENVGINYVNVHGVTALSISCFRKLSSIAMKILDRPNLLFNNLTTNDNNPLNISCNNGLEDVSMKILNYPNSNLDINNTSVTGTTALITACENKMETVCLKILDYPNIQINQINNTGLNALGAAIKSNLEKVCLKILDHPDIHINYINSNKISAHDMAKTAGLINVVERIDQVKELYTKRIIFMPI